VIRASIRAQREAERRYPVRVRIAVPPEGLGRQIEIMHAWLDETCGAEGWATAPAGTRGIVNDALAFYFEDAAFAHAFVADWAGRHLGERVGADDFAILAILLRGAAGLNTLAAAVGLTVH
jgi:hypothetical protein